MRDRLGRTVAVRLLDISNAGCLLESTCRLEKGATGHLRVRFEDAEYMDDVRAGSFPTEEHSFEMDESVLEGL